MKTLQFMLAAAITTFAMFGCAVPGRVAPTDAQIAKAQERNLYGPRPMESEERIRTYLQTALFDPYSMRDLHIGEPEKAYFYRGGGLLRSEYVWWGWRCPVRYNAKNRYGAYTGLKTDHYYFQANGRMLTLERLILDEPDFHAAPQR